MRDTRGFVLVNALVLVAALSAAAVYLLSRADGTRLRTSAAQQAQQISFYLDAGEALATNRLMLDRTSGALDHLGEAWAETDKDLELDADMQNARLSSQTVDAQGLFNLNWLVGSDDAILRAGFRALCIQRGVAPALAETVIDALSADLSTTDQPTGAVIDLPGGLMFMMPQLRDLSGVDDRTYEQLTTFVTVLPYDSALNVNTASAEVLATRVPGTNAAALAGIVQSARDRPFTSVEAFVDALLGTIAEEDLLALNLDLFSVGSEWFRSQITVRLQGRIARRVIVLQRQQLPGGIRVSYRLDDWN